MGLAMRQVKSLSDYLDTLNDLLLAYTEIGFEQGVKQVKKQIPIMQEHLAFWEKTLIEETKDII